MTRAELMAIATDPNSPVVAALNTMVFSATVAQIFVWDQVAGRWRLDPTVRAMFAGRPLEVAALASKLGILGVVGAAQQLDTS